MNILQICNKPPFPPLEGGSLAMNAITQGLLSKGHKVKVLSISSFKNQVLLESFPEWYLKSTQFESVFIDLKIKILPAFLNLFSSKSYHVQRFISKDFERKLIEILKRNTYDIIQLETLYITPYLSVIRKYSNAKIVFRAHNVEHLIWERIAKEAKNLFKNLYLNHLALTLKKYELSVLNEYDGIAAITKNDADFFNNSGCFKPLTDISFGIDIMKYACDYDYNKIDLFYIGAMNWIPNQQGIHWFFDSVWNLICYKIPDLKFYLAGRSMPNWLLQSKYPNIEILGEVEDAKAFINSKSIMVVPLFSGSGIRIKIIEAMAMGKVVITTSIGAEGINYTNNKDIIIANTIEDFKNAIIEIVNNMERRKMIGENARKLIEKEHTNNLLTDKLIAFYEQILKKSSL
ncbi:MAG: glycosyltransferase [Bacteroidetes bacterium]|nr:glycosyltransferase [Bacteroidota bacterium]